MSRLVVDTLQGNSATGNKIVVPSGHSLIAPGHTLQVVQTTTASQVAISSSNETNTGFSATITPKSTSSKVLVTCMLSIQGSGSGGVGFAIYRNGTRIFFDPNSYNGAYFVYANNWRVKVPLEILDSPNNASAVTYSIYMSTYGITGYLSTEGSTSVITLTEIGG